MGFAGLLLLGRLEDRPAGRSRRILIAEGVMAAMTGIGAASLTLIFPVLPYVVVSVAVTAYLGSGWIARSHLVPLGCYLLGAAGFWLTWEALAAWNDLTDAAVSRPGWSPLPAAIALVVAVMGATVFAGSRREGRQPAG